MKNNAVESTDYIMVIVDLELIPEEINMNGMIFKATKVSILKGRIEGVINDNDQNHFDFDLKHWMQWANNFNNRAK